MSAYSIKKRTAFKFVGLLFAIIYGLFIVSSLHYLYSSESGDIGSYLFFFENNKSQSTEFFLNNYSIRGDGAFRIGIMFLSSYLNVDFLTVLSYLAFIMSSLFFCIYSVHIRSSKYLIYILPMFLMIFFTPMVSNLFASGIRSGIAFTILMVSFLYFKSFWRYFLFGIATLIHLSMAPFIALYLLFYVLKKIRIKSPFIIPLFLLSLSSFSIVIASSLFGFNVTPISSSILFNLLILFLGLLMIFTNKQVIKNVYGFMSIGIIFIYLFGFMLDLSYSRYIGNAIILYLFFIIKEGKLGTIQVFTAGYMPFFFLVSFYAISNTI